MEELDIQAVLGQLHELRDPDALLEPENKLLRGVVGRFQLVQPKQEPRGLVAQGEFELCLDVVSPPELRALAQQDNPALTRRCPVLEGRGEHCEILVDDEEPAFDVYQLL